MCLNCTKYITKYKQKRPTWIFHDAAAHLFFQFITMCYDENHRVIVLVVVVVLVLVVIIVVVVVVVID